MSDRKVRVAVSDCGLLSPYLVTSSLAVDSEHKPSGSSLTSVSALSASTTPEPQKFTGKIQLQLHLSRQFNGDHQKTSIRQSSHTSTFPILQHRTLRIPLPHAGLKIGHIDFDSEGVYVRVIPLWMQLPCITFATRSDMMIALGWVGYTSPGPPHVRLHYWISCGKE